MQGLKITKKYREVFSTRDIVGIILGSFILAVAIQWVLVPANLLTGGVGGIAIILKFLSGVDLWVWYLLLNIPIFIAGYKYVSTRFIVYSLIGTLVLTLFLGILKPLDWNLNDSLLSAVLGGVIAGVGSGIIMHSKGSTGGLDIIAVLVRRFRGYNIGQVYFASNLLVLTLSLITFDIKMALFSAISIFISSRVMDMVIYGPELNLTAMIISGNADDITYAIIHNLHRGCTCLSARGAYTGENKNIIMVTVVRTQLPRLKEVVFQLDPQAFITVSETIEVYGKGFRTELSDF
ncbi:MAG: YitT family protein [Syntrophomonadaceae bacterium]|nr:YitT family protein [Syntrophomonadaceae bacterium]